ncbi:dihydroorotate dehydrogenase-like protein [Alkalispirochaeta alkalica]|uniref:dihydroorotate dehydrogenase-like protein n=1 Tax=Alkalispirochaeta alkalica TaxID=46356 RepID=UPI0003675F75|nr:dihydroorotate dehydrogenase-like protein [Alkalispirochaeta alkalica]
MANLKSTYMGLPLKNPFIAGACSMTAHMDSIKRIADAGAGALVIQSLFEEQIQLQKARLEEELTINDNLDAEIQDLFPDIKHSGPDEHLMWVRKAKEAVDIPVIGSLNCVNPETWAEWAVKLAETGVDALELNLFAIPLDPSRSAASIEDEQLDTLRQVKAKVQIPVSVKLSPFYTSPLELIHRMDTAGVDGFVLFNRLFHPSFNIEKETGKYPFNLSSSSDHRLALRFAGLLHGEVQGSICASNGIHTGEDALEVLLAGADVFQAVSTLYKNRITVIESVLGEISAWMDRKGYSSIDDFRGKLSVKKTPDQWTYRRAQYVKMLLKADDYVARPPV